MLQFTNKMPRFLIFRLQNPLIETVTAILKTLCCTKVYELFVDKTAYISYNMCVVYANVRIKANGSDSHKSRIS